MDLGSWPAVDSSGGSWILDLVTLVDLGSVPAVAFGDKPGVAADLFVVLGCRFLCPREPRFDLLGC